MKKHGFVLRKVGDTTLVVPVGARVLELNGLVTLNATGAFVWELLDGTRTAADIAAALEERFEVDAEQARRDVGEFMTRLGEIGVIGDADVRG
ncbi:MAG TPA: PqqD family protein [Thermoanaerobaculaceae bacterium]|nr:PqqD family protein [Thermoanaerobaculaceae bacterium]